MNENIEKAAKVIHDALCDHTPLTLAQDLGAAGLLLTPLHEHALAACEAFAVKYLPMGDRTLVLDKDVWMRVHDVGRESIALKEKAKVPRYVVRDAKVHGWFVEDAQEKKTAIAGCYLNMTEAQARAVAAALNGATE